MAEIADTGAFNAALLRNSSDNYGPTANAGQAATNATSALTNQQAQGAAIQNQNARMQYQLFRQGVEHLTDFSGQNGPTIGNVHDSSGVTAASAMPDAGAPTAGALPSPEDDVGASAAKRAYIEASLEHQYNVDPAGTDAEQRAIVTAHLYATQMKLSGNAGLAAAAEERVKMLQEMRDMGVTSRKNSAQADASAHYQKFSAVESAPEGQALEVLKDVVGPISVREIQKANPDASPEELDEIARDTVAHVGAVMHRFTNRPTRVGEDGALYDEQSGLRVDGVPIRGVSPEKQAELLKQANTLVETPNTDGTVTKEFQYQKDGYKNPNLWVTHAVAEIRSRNDANNAIEAAGNQAAKFGHLNPNAPPVPGGSLYRGPQPGQPGAQPGAPQPAPASLPPGDPKLLRQALTDPEYKLQSPPVIAGRSQTPGDAEQQKANVTARQSLMKDSSDLTSTSSQAKAYTDAALAVLNSPDKPPTGLAAPAQVALSRAVQAIGMTPGDWATRSQELAKYMGNLAVQNFKANFGARPAAKEFDIQMTELNPNNKMTPDAIRDLLESNGRIAKYGIDSGRRAGLYVNQGGDPNRFAEWNEHYFPRSDAVNMQPRRPGQQSSGPASKPDSGGFIPGKRYTDKNGNSATYSGNGQWQ